MKTAKIQIDPSQSIETHDKCLETLRCDDRPFYFDPLQWYPSLYRCQTKYCTAWQRAKIGIANNSQGHRFLNLTSIGSNLERHCDCPGHYHHQAILGCEVSGSQHTHTKDCSCSSEVFKTFCDLLILMINREIHLVLIPKLWMSKIPECDVYNLSFTILTGFDHCSFINSHVAWTKLRFNTKLSTRSALWQYCSLFRPNRPRKQKTIWYDKRHSNETNWSLSVDCQLSVYIYVRIYIYMHLQKNAINDQWFLLRLSHMAKSLPLSKQPGELRQGPALFVLVTWDGSKPASEFTRGILNLEKVPNSTVDSFETSCIPSIVRFELQSQKYSYFKQRFHQKNNSELLSFGCIIL